MTCCWLDIECQLETLVLNLSPLNNFRTYSDSHGKKKIVFNDKLQAKLTERPKTPVLKEMQHYILPKIDEVFKPYLAVSILSWIFIVLNKIRNLPELKFEKK